MACQNHSTVVLLLLVLVSFIALDCINADDSNPFQLNDDVLGLIVFKSDLHDPQNKLSSWSEDDNSPCSWRYIQCNPATGRVSKLSLDGLGLSGKLGRGLRELQSLKVLSLSHNNLTGNIVTDLLLLPAGLQRLNLSHNRFSGQISSAMDIMNSVRVLDLSENFLSGPIPEGVFRVCSLHYLSLAGNSLDGPLPSTLSSCSALNGLILSNNRFTGNPFETGRIWSLNQIRDLDLSRNRFSGPIPIGMLAVHTMKELHLQNNQFSGSIPFDIGYCPHLKEIDLSNNQLTGELPVSLKLLKSLNSLDLSNNMLEGDFPQWIGSMTVLESLDLSKNGLTGSLPQSISNLGSLQNLALSNNNLSGKIPQDLFGMGLEQLDLSWNQLTGSIPTGSSRFFESLIAMDLSGNKLRGDIPPEIGLFTNLAFLNLSWNSINSQIPPELGYLQKLAVLDMRHSELYGPIPGDICVSGSLSILQLDGNSLTGLIPPEIGNCTSLSLLSLSHNNLSGMIPRTMETLKKLEILRLEFNQLTGEIPPQLGTLQNLLAANVSYNRLIGRLPQAGIFPSLDQTALQGNLGLCSPLLKGPCKMNVSKPLVLDPNAYPSQMRGHGGEEGDGSSPPSRLDHSRRFLSLSAIIAMAAAIAIIAGVVVIAFLNASARKRLETVADQKPTTDSLFSTSSRTIGGTGSPTMGKLILFDSKSPGEWIPNPESLFSKASEIGSGALGTVYKATLEAENRAVAIKRLFQTNILQHPDDFDREVRQLGKIRHPNLVSLRGYYWTPQLQLIISDYIPNTSLQAKMASRPPLSWTSRFKIMLGTAKGLAHLHHSCSPPIIHYNLKPTNVLLDENHNAKVSDFGLLKLLTKTDRNVMSHRFKSALGYMAPELACPSLRVNEKCDVYGFGVMALELVTGRRPVEYGEDNVVILNEDVRVLLEQGNMLDCVDRRMGDFPEEEVLPVLKVALVCTSQVPSSRPSMAEVVRILQVIMTPVPPRIEAY